MILQTTTFFKRNADATPRQSFQFYFTHKDLSGEISHENITSSEKEYTQAAPEWVSLDNIKKIDFRHSVDLKTIMNAYNKG